MACDLFVLYVETVTIITSSIYLRDLPLVGSEL